MRASSLALRLFLSATAVTVVILVVTGIILSSIYREAVERSYDRRLGVYLRTLVADVAAPEQAGDRGAPPLGEPLFELPLSGWYWQITPLGIVERRQVAVPQRTRRADLGLGAALADDLPVPARQRQLEQRFAQRRLGAIGRLLRRRDIGDQSAQIDGEPTVE